MRLLSTSVEPMIVVSQVVEVMRDAAGELADRLHLLRLAQLGLELQPLDLAALALGDLGLEAGLGLDELVGARP